MPSWITAKKKKTFSQGNKHFQSIQNHSVINRDYSVAYKIVTTHFLQEKPVHLIINGEAGTGKSFLIYRYAIYAHLKGRCKVTATTGKAAYCINGITIHSSLRLPVACMSQKELSGEALITIQERLTQVDYIIIDEYSMLGQASQGWIDR